MSKKTKTLTEEETLWACWAQFDGPKDGVTRKGKHRLRDPESVDADVTSIINSGRLCTMAEMAEWVGPPASHTPPSAIRAVDGLTGAARSACWRSKLSSARR